MAVTANSKTAAMAHPKNFSRTLIASPCGCYYSEGYLLKRCVHRDSSTRGIYPCRVKI
jgi:hypothetical protein